MSIHSLKITETQAFEAQIIHLPRKLSIVQATRAEAYKQPIQNQSLSTYSPYKPSPSFIGISFTLALHATGLFILFTGEIQQKTLPASPIRVALLSAPQHETLKPQANPQNKKTAVKPQKALNPKPMLAASSHASEQAEAPTAPSNTINPEPTSVAQEGPAQEAPVTLPHLNADYLNNPAPDYPSTSRQSGEQGRVLMRALIDAEGRVERIELRKTSGYNLLDQAALDTVKNWRFVPAYRGKQPVSAWIVIPISFTLEG